MDKKKIIIFVVTFFVAFCSIIYELIYSQLLVVIFGGTVLRYSITIGLFLFSLGIGSFLYNYLGKLDKKKFFIFVELGLSFIGFFGVVFIIWLNSYFLFLPHMLRIILSNIPIILIGILSGLDLPLLSYFAGEKSSEYSKVLGIDYFGSLGGTLIYALFLYPSGGLIATSALVATLNLLVSILLFFFLFKKRDRLLFFLLSIFTILFTIILFNLSYVSDFLMKVYLQQTVLENYSSWVIKGIYAVIDEIVYTPYQMIFTYSIFLNYSGETSLLNKCLNIDEHVQMCDSWVQEYHNGLIDVPISFFDNTSPDTEVLLIGGGDGIPVNYLSNYNVSIDQVDIDNKFIEYGRKSEVLSHYQNNSSSYSYLDLHIEDGFSYLRNNDKLYDLVILDLPGLKSDKLLSLYSKEFFIFLNRSLKEKGIAVLWVYSSKNKEYHKILLNTISSAGFNYYLNYSSYKLPGRKTDVVEDYFIISKDNSRVINLSKNSYVIELEEFYGNLEWKELGYSDEIRINSIFKPSYPMIIEDEK